VAEPGRTLGMGEVATVEGPFVVAPFGNTLAELGDEREDVVALTADMGRYSDINAFRDRHPRRFFNVGMAEQNLLAVSAGLAKAGKAAFAATYAVFITRRAYDFMAIAVAHSRANVKIFAGTPGLVNGYGATHQAIEDLNMVRAIPGMVVIDPCDAVELAQVVRAAADHDGPVYVRNLRGNVPVHLPEDYRFRIGAATLLRPGSDVAVISTGLLTPRAMAAAGRAAAEDVDTAVLHVPTIKPFDVDAVVQLASSVQRVVVAENHQQTGGLATLVVEALYTAGVQRPLARVGLEDDRFFDFGSQGWLEERFGTSEDHVLAAIRGE
jgi:transketolase